MPLQAILFSESSLRRALNEFITDDPVVPCDEPDRLALVYINAIAQETKAGKVLPALTSGQWNDAIRDTRAYQKALAVLTAHRNEHSC